MQDFKERGVILLVVLWSFVLIGIIAGVTVYSIKLEFKKAIYRLEEIKNLYLINAGITMVKWELNRDRNQYDSLTEPWKTNPEAYHSVNIEHGTYTLEVEDEQGKINLNAGNPIIFENYIKNRKLGRTAEIIDSVADWTDPDTEKRLDGGERDYYGDLTPARLCKGTPFDTLYELLLVKGMDANIFSSIKNDLTVYGSGRININTCGPTVLRAIPGISPSIADAIISYRKGMDEKEGTEDDGFFASVGDITRVVPSVVYQRMSHFVTVRSEFFRVNLTARAGKIIKRVECIIKKLPYTTEVIYWREF